MNSQSQFISSYKDLQVDPNSTLPVNLGDLDILVYIQV